MSASSWPSHLVAFALGATAATLVLLTVTDREPTSYAEHSVQAAAPDPHVHAADPHAQGTDPKPAPAMAPNVKPAGSALAGLGLTLPEGWREVPSDKGNVRRFTLAAGEATCAISLWPANPMMSDPLANLNRWRGQVGLAPVVAADLAKELTEDRTGATPFSWCELRPADATAKGILAAMAQVPSGVLFVKIDAPAAKLETTRQGFLALCRSLKPGASE